MGVRKKLAVVGEERGISKSEQVQSFVDFFAIL